MGSKLNINNNNQIDQKKEVVIEDIDTFKNNSIGLDAMINPLHGGLKEAITRSEGLNLKIKNYNDEKKNRELELEKKYNVENYDIKINELKYNLFELEGDTKFLNDLKTLLSYEINFNYFISMLYRISNFKNDVWHKNIIEEIEKNIPKLLDGDGNEICPKIKRDEIKSAVTILNENIKKGKEITINRPEFEKLKIFENGKIEVKWALDTFFNLDKIESMVQRDNFIIKYREDEHGYIVYISEDVKEEKNETNNITKFFDTTDYEVIEKTTEEFLNEKNIGKIITLHKEIYENNKNNIKTDLVNNIELREFIKNKIIIGSDFDILKIASNINDVLNSLTNKLYSFTTDINLLYIEFYISNKEINKIVIKQDFEHYFDNELFDKVLFDKLHNNKYTKKMGIVDFLENDEKLILQSINKRNNRSDNVNESFKNSMNSFISKYKEINEEINKLKGNENELSEEIKETENSKKKRIEERNNEISKDNKILEINKKIEEASKKLKSIQEIYNILNDIFINNTNLPFSSRFNKIIKDNKKTKDNKNVKYDDSVLKDINDELTKLYNLLKNKSRYNLNLEDIKKIKEVLEYIEKRRENIIKLLPWDYESYIHNGEIKLRSNY